MPCPRLNPAVLLTRRRPLVMTSRIVADAPALFLTGQPS